MSTIALLTIVVGLALIAATVWRIIERKKEMIAEAQIDDLAAMGDVVAGGRYPNIDPNRCIGSGACVAACPEKNVLAVVNGRGVLANPLACVGHGVCADACPLDAITLVYGSATQAVTLPRFDERYETNQPGMYIIGELGGMGLIRNAVRQGADAAKHIARNKRRGSKRVWDAVVIGAGPAGISAILGLKKRGLRGILVDREELGGTILHYPRAKVVMTGTLDFPVFGKVKASTMSKEELVALWKKIDAQVSLPFEGGKLVEHIYREDDTWSVKTADTVYRGANVVLALGRRGSPQKLEVAGEELSKVAYRLLEPEEFRGKHVLVVGGGNSAVETAISLAQAGDCASIGISYRRNDFARCRGDNRRLIAELIDAGQIVPLFNTTVTKITEKSVEIRFSDGRDEKLRNDAVIVQIGGTPPSKLLEKFGVEMVEKRGHE